MQGVSQRSEGFLHLISNSEAAKFRRFLFYDIRHRKTRLVVELLCHWRPNGVRDARQARYPKFDAYSNHRRPK